MEQMEQNGTLSDTLPSNNFLNTTSNRRNEKMKIKEEMMNAIREHPKL